MNWQGILPSITSFDIAHHLLSGPLGSTTPEPGTVQRVLPYSSFRLSNQNHRVKTGGVVELRLTNKEVNFTPRSLRIY
jgi:hypothetical protein